MSDVELIHKIQNGDSSSFKLLVERHQALVFRTAVGFVHTKEDAEDIAQEVFIKVFQSLHSFKGDSEFITWLYRITVNTCITHAHKQKRLSFMTLAENLFQYFPEKTDEDKNPEQKMIAHERDDKIKKAIDALPHKQRTAFVLSKYDELSQKEIAVIMQTSEGAVEQHLQRAKTALQKKLIHFSRK